MEAEANKVGSKVKRRKVLQSTSLLAGFSMATTNAAAAYEPDSKDKDVLVVETITKFEIGDIDKSELPHIDLMVGYGVDTEKEELYVPNNGIFQDLNNIHDGLIIGDNFGTLPHIINKGRSSKELPVNEGGFPNRFLPISSRIGFPAINIKSDGDNSVIAKSQNEEYTINSREEVVIEPSLKNVQNRHNDKITVEPEIHIRNYGKLDIHIYDKSNP